MRVQSLFAIGLSLFAAVPGSAKAQIFDEDYQTKEIHQGIGLSGDIAIRSVRMFRGQNLYDGTSLQPELEFGLGTNSGKFFGRVFGHFGLDQSDPPQAGSAPFDSTVTLTDEDGAESDDTAKVALTGTSFTELDYTIGWSNSLDFFDFEAGHRWYTYSKTRGRIRDTAELYAQTNINTILYPHLLAAYDWDEFEGWYFEGGIEQPFTFDSVIENATLTPSITIGFNSSLDDGSRFIYDDSGITHLQFGLRSNLPLGERFSLEPELNFTEAEDDAANSEIWFGLNLKGALDL